MNGSDPSPQNVAYQRALLAGRQVDVFVYNEQVTDALTESFITLARQLGDRSNEMHRGTWNKVSSKCWEIRGKTLGMYCT